MWIRRQNRRFLGDYDNFSVSEGGNVLGFQGPNDYEGVVLGAYEKEETALIVLDNIHSCISQGTLQDIIYKNVRTTSNLVFDMPLQEEVIIDSEVIEGSMEVEHKVIEGI